MPFNIVMFCLRSKFLSSENSLHSKDSDVFFGQFLGFELPTYVIYRLGIQELWILAAKPKEAEFI